MMGKQIHIYVHDHRKPARRRTKDASPEMQAFQQRQEARKAKAVAGKSECSVLLGNVKAALRVLKGRGETPHNGMAAGAERAVKRADAGFGLAINNLGNQNDYDRWMAIANHDLKAAEEAVKTLQRQAIV